MRGWLARIAPTAVLLGCTAGSASAAEADWPQLGQTPAHYGFNAAETRVHLGNVAGLFTDWTGTYGAERGRRVLARRRGRRRLHRRLPTAPCPRSPRRAAARRLPRAWRAYAQ